MFNLFSFRSARFVKIYQLANHSAVIQRFKMSSFVRRFLQFFYLCHSRPSIEEDLGLKKYLYSKNSYNLLIISLKMSKQMSKMLTLQQNRGNRNCLLFLKKANKFTMMTFTSTNTCYYKIKKETNYSIKTPISNPFIFVT